MEASATNRHTSYWMERRNEMAEIKSSKQTRQVFVSVFQEIEELLAVAFGPEGRAVLVQSQTGEMNITRSGLNILRAAFSGNNSPILKYILKCAENFHEECGDGVKSVLFMIGAMLKYCENFNETNKAIQQLSKLQSNLSLLGLSHESSDLKTINSNISNESCYFFKIIDTFLSTRFPPVVSSILVPLMHEWIFKLSSCSCTDGGITLDLQTLITNFSVLCRCDTGSRPVSDSRITAGFILSRQATKSFKSGYHNVVLLLFDDEDAIDGKFDDEDIKAEVNRALNDIKVSKKEIYIGDPTEYLLVTSKVLPEISLFHLNRENVAVIHCSPLKEVKYLSMLMHKHQRESDRLLKYWPVDVAYDPNKESTLFNIPSAHTLEVCGPTMALRSEYMQTCYFSLKLLTKVNTMTACGLISAGGDFERNVHKIIFNKFNLYKRNVPCLSSRTELMDWRRNVSDVGLMNCTHSLEENRIYQAIPLAFRDTDEDVAIIVLQGLLSITQKLARCESMLKPTGMESVHFKLVILNHALASVISILKMDCVIS